jgi:pimeloyl-ACP methyl ester carboxylesterase
VFYFHGFPGSRLDWVLFDPGEISAEMNIRIIAPDRPGYGLSDFCKIPKLLGWPGDVEELANALSIKIFDSRSFGRWSICRGMCIQIA